MLLAIAKIIFHSSLGRRSLAPCDDALFLPLLWYLRYGMRGVALLCVAIKVRKVIPTITGSRELLFSGL